MKGPRPNLRMTRYILLLAILSACGGQYLPERGNACSGNDGGYVFPLAEEASCHIGDTCVIVGEPDGVCVLLADSEPAWCDTSHEPVSVFPPGYVDCVPADTCVGRWITASCVTSPVGVVLTDGPAASHGTVGATQYCCAGITQ